MTEVMLVPQSGVECIRLTSAIVTKVMQGKLSPHATFRELLMLEQFGFMRGELLGRENIGGPEEEVLYVLLNAIVDKFSIATPAEQAAALEKLREIERGTGTELAVAIDMMPVICDDVCALQAFAAVSMLEVKPFRPDRAFSIDTRPTTPVPIRSVSHYFQEALYGIEVDGCNADRLRLHVLSKRLSKRDVAELAKVMPIGNRPSVQPAHLLGFLRLQPYAPHGVFGARPAPVLFPVRDMPRDGKPALLAAHWTRRDSSGGTGIVLNLHALKDVDRFGEGAVIASLAMEDG